MAYGIEFVDQQTNQVGFWLWRISTAVHDTEEFSEEAQNLVLDEDSSELYRHFLRHEPWYKHRVADMQQDGVGSLSVFQHAQLALEHAREIAKDRGPDDSQAIASLEQIFEAVSHDMEKARSLADDSASKI
jgi:hypothetical protein